MHIAASDPESACPLSLPLLLAARHAAAAPIERLCRRVERVSQRVCRRAERVPHRHAYAHGFSNVPTTSPPPRTRRVEKIEEHNLQVTIALAVIIMAALNKYARGAEQTMDFFLTRPSTHKHEHHQSPRHKAPGSVGKAAAARIDSIGACSMTMKRQARAMTPQVKDGRRERSRQRNHSARTWSPSDDNHVHECHSPCQ